MQKDKESGATTAELDFVHKGRAGLSASFNMDEESMGTQRERSD